MNCARNVFRLLVAWDTYVQSFTRIARNEVLRLLVVVTPPQTAYVAVVVLHQSPAAFFGVTGEKGRILTGNL